MHLLRQYRDIENLVSPTLLMNTLGNANAGGLTDEIRIAMVREAVIEFVEDTKVLRHYVDIPIECGVCDYPILVDNCERVIGVGEVSYKDCQTDCLGSNNWNWHGVEFSMKQDEDVLRVAEPPSSGGEILHIELFVSPERDACKVDNILYERYLKPITDLALERLHLMTDVPWASISRAQYYRRLYESRTVETNERRMDRGRRGRKTTLKAIRAFGAANRR